MEESTITERINEALKYRDITPKQFADRLGLHPATVYRYLNGDRIPRSNTISQMSEVLRVNPAWLLGYNVPMIEDSVPYDFTFEKDNTIHLIEKLTDDNKTILRGIIEGLLAKQERDDGESKV